MSNKTYREALLEGCQRMLASGPLEPDMGICHNLQKLAGTSKSYDMVEGLCVGFRGISALTCHPIKVILGRNHLYGEYWTGQFGEARRALLTHLIARLQAGDVIESFDLDAEMERKS